MSNWPDVCTIPNISPHQRAELAKALAGRVGCLTGGAGVGKSHTIANLVAALPVGSVSLSAPTGKAAVRMMELMTQHGLSAPAQTIHSLLIPSRSGYDGDGWSFEYNRWNQMPYDVYIVDEATMLDTKLACSFLQAVPDDACVLFVGDPGQLPPVGKGRPFVDMIEAGLPHGHLSEPHRFAGRIGSVCDEVRKGKVWTPSEQLDLDADFPENFRHVAKHYPPAQIEALRFVVRRVIERGFDPIADMQVLAGLNDKGALSCKALNTILQGILNPIGAGMDGCPFRIGDKVMCTRNGWRLVAAPTPDRPSMYVANGEMGRVIDFGTRGGTMLVEFPAREDAAVFGKDEWKDGVQLGFAVTVHKSQGSQWPVVTTMIDPSAGRITSRAFWYTAFSRAEKLAFTIGNKSIVNADCKRVDIDRRVTLLKNRLESARMERELEKELQCQT